ncbi:unnamed protein product [Pieris macdunnoughi]|uniref:Lipase n=1 Tax=Pieris macdunnoughi TaxID=345717 RepID=A0A821SZ48_9NEOP|nr:unnamed protein product [Pieris macdunnoughi]
MWFKSILVLCIVLPSYGNQDTCQTHDKIVKAGYTAERYDVVTEDGYILEVNRIPRGKGSSWSSKRPVVFMMHGLTGCSNSYVELGSQYAMGFNLADSGFDVWLGNARGVGNSRRHKSLNPDNNRQKSKFFDFSWEEIALYDLPAMIEFALKTAGQDKLHYVGHSQGGTVFLVLNSMKPEYNKKFISAHLLAGVGYQKNFPNSLLKTAARFTTTIHNLAKTSGIYEIMGPDWNSKNAIAKSGCANGACSRSSEVEDIIEEIVNGADLVAGSSVKQFAHFGQNINDRVFRRFYYTPSINLLKYGSLSPPEYNLKKVNVDITMHYALGDDILDERDVLSMVADLPRAKARKVAKDTFSHVDFVASSLVKQLVTDYIIDDLKRR